MTQMWWIHTAFDCLQQHLDPGVTHISWFLIFRLHVAFQYNAPWTSDNDIKALFNKKACIQGVFHLRQPSFCLQMSAITHHTPAAAWNRLDFPSQMSICVWSEACLGKLLRESPATARSIYFQTKETHENVTAGPVYLAWINPHMNVISQHYCVLHIYWCCTALDANV